MCLYATARVAGISFEDTVKGTAPFYFPLAVTLLAITFVPWLTLALT